MNWRLLAAGAAAFVVMTGCGGGGSNDEKFFYRFSNAGPFLASGVDFLVDKQMEAQGVAYDASTDYVETDLEKTNVFFDVLDNTTGEFLDAIVWEKEDEQNLHLFAVGVKNGPQTLQPPAQLTAVLVNRTTPQGNVRIVFVNGYSRRAGTQTPNVDLLRTGQIQPVVADLEFADSRTFVLPGGTFTLTARYAGLKSGEFLSSPPTLFQAGKIYIVLLEGVEDAASPFEPKFRIFEEPIRDP
jgi:hypothetical protein